MHITSIKVKNFRGIEDFSATIDGPVALLWGPNGSGKTTILDAIRFVMTGTVRDQAGDGIPLQGLVGPWADRGFVGINLADGDKGMKVWVKFNATKSALETDPPLTGKVQEVRAGIWSYFGLDPERERLALDPLALLLGKDLLDGLAGNTEIPHTALQNLFGKLFEHAMTLLDQNRLALKTTADVEKVAAALYDLRTKVNRQAKVMSGALEASTVTQPTSKKGALLTGDDIPAVQKQIRDLLEKRNEVLGQKIAAEQGRSKAAIDKEIKTLEAKLRQMAKNPPALDPEPAYPTAPEEVTEQAHRQAKEDHDKALAALKALGTVCEVCPTCKREMDAEAVAAQQAAIDAAEEAYAKALSTWTTVYEAWEEYLAWEQDCFARRSAWVEKNKRITEVYESEKALVQSDLDRVRKEVPAGDVTALKAEYDRIQTQAEAGQDLIDKIEAWEQQESNKKEMMRLEMQSAFMTQVLDILRDPASLRSLGEDRSVAFELQMNDWLNMFGYQIRCNWEAGRVEMSEDAAERWRPLSQVSAGELTLAQIAVADVYGGRGLALIDRFEGVDKGNADTVWNLLRCPVGGRVLAQTAEELDVAGVCCVAVREEVVA